MVSTAMLCTKPIKVYDCDAISYSGININHPLSISISIKKRFNSDIDKDRQTLQWRL